MTMPDLTALSALREAADMAHTRYIAEFALHASGMTLKELWERDRDASHRYHVALVNAVPALIAELEAAREVVAAAESRNATCGNVRSVCWELYPDAHCVPLCRALANHKEATR